MYYPKEDPMGKTYVLQDDDLHNELVKIAGVFKELPNNTHMKFDVLFSYKTLARIYPFRTGAACSILYPAWGRKDMYVFVQLRPGTDPAKHWKCVFLRSSKNINPNNRAQASQKDVISLQPIADIHFAQATWPKKWKQTAMNASYFL